MKAYLRRMERKDEYRCRKWQLVATDPRGATHTRMAVGVGKREAAKLLAAFAEECGAGLVVRKAPGSFLDWFLHWNDVAHDTSRPGGAVTHRKALDYSAAIRRHIGPMRLQDVTAEDVERMYVALRSGDSPSGKKWTGTSLATLHSMLVPAFALAKRRGKISADPMADVCRPKPDTKERKAMRMAEAAEFDSRLSVADHREFCIKLILATGMSAKEACSVTVGDYRPWGIEIREDAVKNREKVRTLPVGAAARDLIDLRLSIVADSLAALGEGLADGTHLVCDDAGRPVTPEAMRRWWRRNRGRWGMDGWTLHEFRHTMISNLAEAKVHPDVMQKIAGHTDPRTTHRIYTQINQEDMAEAFEQLSRARADALNGARGE